MEPSDSTTRELTLEEAVSFAILLQKNEQLAEAHAVYRRVLEAAPDHPRALHYAGLLAHQQGRNGEALALIERSLAHAPDQADWCSNRGVVLQSDGRLEAAIEAYRRAITIDPGHANAHNNLGVLLRATGRPDEAEAAYRAAIRLNPEHIDAYTNLGILLNGLQRTEEAAACYCRAITLRPKYREARKLLALAHCTLGEFGKAAEIFEQWLAEEPADPIARHMLAACTGRNVPARASNGFVQATFDSFAASFEAKLASLSYRAPALVAAMLEDAGLAPSHALDVLDAGCGTGLCGALVAPFARRLVGVDLSDGMLAHARDKTVYHALIRAELTEYASDNGEAFDLIVSADTLVYFGELEGIVAVFVRALRPRGLLVFTLEHAVGNGDVDYRLQPHGRYSHGRCYVERLLTSADLRPKIIEAELRMEAGAPVPGLVIRAEKPVSAKSVSAKPVSAKPVAAKPVSWLSATTALSAAALPEPVIECREHELSRHHQQPPYPAHDLDHGTPPYHAGLNQRAVDLMRYGSNPRCHRRFRHGGAIVAVWLLGYSQTRTRSVSQVSPAGLTTQVGFIRLAHVRNPNLG